MNTIQVMVVEDEGIVSIDIRNILTRRGYIVNAVAFSGEEAIRKSRESCPDIVLMDIGLKGNLDGIEAALQIKQICDIPIIFLTGFADESTLSRAREVKPAGYIVKPINENDLADSIAAAVA
jgi:CheY-like chemotaxis protein